MTLGWLGMNRKLPKEVHGLGGVYSIGFFHFRHSQELQSHLQPIQENGKEQQNLTTHYAKRVKMLGKTVLSVRFYIILSEC